jgi:hypothetical protein
MATWLVVGLEKNYKFCEFPKSDLVINGNHVIRLEHA